MPVNNTDADEVRIPHEMFGDVSEKTGLNPEQMAAWLNRQGLNVTWGTGGPGDGAPKPENPNTHDGRMD